MFILLIIFSVVSIGAIIALMRSEKSAAHIFAEAKFELFYNLAGTKSVIEDILMRSKNVTELYSIPNKTVVITGGTRGIGIEVIKMFLNCDMRIIVGCRKPETADALLKKLRDDGITKGSLESYKLDTSSFESVEKFARIVKDKCPSIHILLNLAGIMYVPFELSEDGYESQFATNYLGHFYLTHLLFPEIKAAGIKGSNARIVNVSSCAHAEGDIEFNDINFTKTHYIAWKAYAQSKLAQVLFSNYLNKLMVQSELPVQVHSVHPGVVNTDLFERTLLKKITPWFINLVFKTPEKGAVPIVHTCIAKYLEGRGGTYISNCRIMPTSELASSEELQETLFDFTNKLLKIEEFGKL